MTFEEFEQRFFHATSWSDRKDGPPLEDLDRLTPADRNRAEIELVNRLSLGDSWAIQGLAYLRSTKALPRLRELLPRAKGAIKGQIALAIWKSSEDPEMLQVILDLSRSNHLSDTPSAEVFELIDVVHMLAQFPHPAAKARLEELTSHPEDLVSYNAKYALQLRKSHYGIETAGIPSGPPPRF